MANFKRYAIYYAPSSGPLLDFASSWLGWDAATSLAIPHPEIDSLPLTVSQITEKPRKYGFHGTIKPPFALADDTSQTELTRDLAQLTKNLKPVKLDGLELAAIGRFLALVPVGDQSDLGELAGRVVTEMDHHRAPPSEEELLKRRRRSLSSRQEELLEGWGYPYVLDQFKFHLTLTGSLPKAHVASTLKALDQVVTPLLPRPFEISDLCLFGEATDGRFHIIERFQLTG